MMKRIPSPRPSPFISFASVSGLGSMCGRPDSESAIASMSKNTEPGIWPWRNSARPFRPVGGRCQDESITPSLGSPRSAASSAVVQKLRVGKGLLRSGRGIGQRDAHAPVDLALLFDTRDRGIADFAGAGDMGAPARLEVETFDGDQPYATGARRRLDRHRLDEPGIGRELLVGDPPLGDGSVGGDQRVEP